MVIVGNRTLTEGVITYGACFRDHCDAEIIVNTSPVGMYPKIDRSPVDLTHFPHCEAVVDIIANPLTTKLVAQARELGMKGITGLEMSLCLRSLPLKSTPIVLSSTLLTFRVSS